MKRIYRTLLGLYPLDYTARFAGQMLAACENAAEEPRARGGAVFLRFAILEMAGLVEGATREWMAKLTTEKSVRGRRLPDLRMMRPVGVPRELWFAGAGATLSGSPAPDDVSQAQRRIALLVSGMTDAIARRDYEQARTLSYQEGRERQKLRRIPKQRSEE